MSVVYQFWIQPGSSGSGTEGGCAQQEKEEEKGHRGIIGEISQNCSFQIFTSNMALSSLGISWFQIFLARTFNAIEIGTWLRDFHKYLLDSALPWKLNGHILWVQTLWGNEAYFGLWQMEGWVLSTTLKYRVFFYTGPPLKSSKYKKLI